jgi:hypothetical protein
MYIYVFFFLTGFCILSILWKQNKNIDIHEYWVLYSQYSPETEPRKHRCTCILGFVFSVFSPEPSIHVHLCFLLYVSREYKEYRTQYAYISMFSSFCFQRIQRIQNPVDVHVYWVLYSQYSLETERRKHRCTYILGSVFSVFSGNRKKKT